MNCVSHSAQVLFSESTGAQLEKQKHTTIKSNQELYLKQDISVGVLGGIGQSLGHQCLQVVPATRRLGLLWEIPRGKGNCCPNQQDKHKHLNILTSLAQASINT